MKALRILSIFGIIIGILMILTSSTLLFFSKKPSGEITLSEQTYKEEDTPKQQEKEIDSEEEPLLELQESGWIPNWAFDLGYESLQNNKDIIDTVNPVLYTVNSSGNIVNRGVPEISINNLLNFSKENNIRVIPTVGSYDYVYMKNSLTNDLVFQNNISTIISEIDKYGFDGIDLDYEMINQTEKDRYIEFIMSLKTELSKKNKILSVTVFPQWENATYTDHQETRISQDYPQIGSIVDEVRIMAYDYTLLSSDTPGPIAPLTWIKQILDYSTNVIPKEKIWLGIHLYSYEWVEGKTVALTYTSTKNIINNVNINTSFREDIGEGYAEFGCEGNLRCVMYYQNEQGVQMRRVIAKEYGIAGVSYWRLGGEMDILKN